MRHGSPNRARHGRARAAIAVFAALALAGTPALAQPAAPPPAPPGPTSQALLSTGTTILGQPLDYPDGTPAVTSSIISLAPGVSTGWHRHGAPLFAYILEGELTVDYGDRGSKTYRTGEAVMEAVDLPHNGTNTGTGMVRILAVYIGASDAVNATPVPPPN